MTNISMYHLPEDIRAEFTVDEKGLAFASRRAVARLADVNLNSVQNLLVRVADQQKCPQCLESYAGQSFEPDQQIPDLLVALILEYYGYEAQERYRTEQAKKVCRAFRAIGFRTWVQQELGWQKPMSQAEYLLSVAQQFVEQERQMKLMQSQVKTVENKVNTLSQQTEEIKKVQNSQDDVLMLLMESRRQAEQDLQSIPFSLEKARQMTTRDKIVLLVRTYCYFNETPYNQFYSHLYRQLKYRYHYDVKARCRNKKTSLIEQVDKDGMIEALYAIASEIIKEKIEVS